MEAIADDDETSLEAIRRQLDTEFPHSTERVVEEPAAAPRAGRAGTAIGLLLACAGGGAAGALISALSPTGEPSRIVVEAAPPAPAVASPRPPTPAKTIPTPLPRGPKPVVASPSPAPVAIVPAPRPSPPPVVVSAPVPSTPTPTVPAPPRPTPATVVVSPASPVAAPVVAGPPAPPPPPVEGADTARAASGAAGPVGGAWESFWRSVTPPAVAPAPRPRRDSEAP
jgi:hypothetical protein